MSRKKWFNSSFSRVVVCFVCMQILLACSASADCPDVTLTGLDNEQHKVCEYIGAGKWTVVNIWGPKCPACIEEIPELVDFHDSHYDKDATVLGIALDFPSYGYAKHDDVAKVVDDYLVEYPNLLSDGEVAAKLGAKPLRGTPTTLIFNRNGSLVLEHVGIITTSEIEEVISQHVVNK